MNRVQAFGQNYRSIQALASDPRCVVSYRVLWKRLRLYGWAVDDAARTESTVTRYNVWDKTFSTLDDVAADERCEVELASLKRRVYTGIPLHDAVNTLPTNNLYRVWGAEFLRLKDIAADPRCRVEYRTLTYRLASGVPLEVATFSHHQYIQWKKERLYA